MTREDRIIYEVYLKADEWKKKRIAKAEEQNYKCERCVKDISVEVTKKERASTGKRKSNRLFS